MGRTSVCFSRRWVRVGIGRRSRCWICRMCSRSMYWKSTSFWLFCRVSGTFSEELFCPLPWLGLAYACLLFAERSVLTFPLDALESDDPAGGMKRMKRISSHTSFFKAGQCLGRTLVCVVKASSLSSTIKTLEPIDQNVRGKNKPTFKKLLQGGNDTLKVFKVCILCTPQRCSTNSASIGILHPNRIPFHPFPENKVVRGVHKRLRDCRSRNAGYPGPVGPRGRVAGLCTAPRRRAAIIDIPNRRGVFIVLYW
jgi:hypothetical protein